MPDAVKRFVGVLACWMYLVAGWSGDLNALSGPRDISLSEFEVCRAETLPLQAVILPPVTYNVSLLLGSDISFNEFVDAKPIIFNALSTLTQKPLPTIDVLAVHTSAVNATMPSPLVVDVQFTLDTVWRCISGTSANVVVGEIYGGASADDALVPCITSFPACSASCRVEQGMPASVEAQRQEIWTALHSTLFQPSLGANLSLATLKESVVLFPSSNARDPITIGTTPAYSSLQRQPYVTLRLAATCHIDNLTLDATTATSRPCNGIDAQFLAFALFDTFDGHLALRPHTFIVHAPVSIRSEVYRMASSVFVVDVAAAVDRTHTLVHQFLQQSMGQLRSHLSQSNPTMALLAMSIDDVTSWQPVPLPSYSSSMQSFLNLTLSCPWNVSMWTKGMPLVMRALQYASLPVAIQTHPSSGLPLYVEIPNSTLSANTTTTRTVLFPLVARVDAVTSMGLTVEMSTQLGLVDTPLYCNLAPRMSLLPPIVQTSPPVVAMVYVEVQVPVYNSFVSYWLGRAIVATVAPLGVMESDVRVHHVQVVAGTEVPTVEVAFEIACATQAQTNGLGVFLGSSAWPFHVDRFVTPNVNQSAVVHLRWQAATPPPTTMYPGVSSPGLRPPLIGCDAIIHTTTFSRPPKRYQYLALQSPSYGPPPNVMFQISAAAEFGQNPFFLDKMSSRSDVRMAMNDDAVAAIVSSSHVTHWTFYTPPDVMLDTLQVCLYLEQVQSVSPTTDESRAAAAVVVCVESVQGAAVHVSIQIAQPHRLAASHSIVGLNVVVLTLSNAVASTDPTHALVPVHTWCSSCQQHFAACRDQPVCREFVMGCLPRQIWTTTALGAKIPWGRAYFATLAENEFLTHLSILDGLDACFHESLAQASNASTATRFLGNQAADGAALAMAMLHAWGLYMQGLSCLAMFQCPLGVQSLPQSTLTYPSVRLGRSVIQDVVANVQLPTTLVFTSAATNRTLVFAWFFVLTQELLRTTLLAAFYPGLDPQVAPFVGVSVYTAPTGQITLYMTYTLLPCVATPPTLQDAERSIPIEPSALIFPTSSWPRMEDTDDTGTSSSLVGGFDYLTSYGVCPAYDLASPLQTTPDLLYLSYVNTTLEPHVPRLIRSFFFDELSTCVGGMPGVVLQREIDAMLNDPRCASVFAFDWHAVHWNATTSSPDQDDYTTKICPMYAAGRPCFRDTFLPAMDRLLSQSGGCCDSFVAQMQANFGLSPTAFVATAVAKAMDVMCSASTCTGTSVQLCGARTFQQLTSPWIEHALKAFQVHEDQACAAAMGQTITTFSGVSGPLYTASCPLGGCMRHWDALLTWIKSFPILATYPTDGFRLIDLFEAREGVDGALLLGFWNDMLVRWHSHGLVWPILDAWTSSFYSNLDYVYTNWMAGHKFYVATNFSTSCEVEPTAPWHVTVAASQWQCVLFPGNATASSVLLVRVADRNTIQCVANQTGPASPTAVAPCSTFAHVDACYSATAAVNPTSLYTCSDASLVDASTWCGYTRRLMDRTSWHCVASPTSSSEQAAIVAVRLANATGDVECLQSGWAECQTFPSVAACADAMQFYTPRSLQTLRCGIDGVKFFGHAGYFDPTHWCAVAAAYFDLTPSIMWPPWRCTAGAGDDILVARVNKDNDAECWSSNKYNCLWLPNLTVCDATLRNLTKAAALAPLSCGRVYNTMWGEPGYSNPGHWCAKVARMWSLQHTPTPFVCAPVSNPPVVVYAVRRNSMRHVECFHGIDVEGCAAFATVQECQDQVALLESGGAAAQTTTCSSYSNLSHWCVAAQSAIDAPTYVDVPPDQLLVFDRSGDVECDEGLAAATQRFDRRLR
ncbi:hypothetical protein H310_10725 [Aphanomyces invadans]|uniref:Secreted protein n=1 Tax=Aphanomyces invadans TaxID=157072 RepID=A0A024TQ00_9STRA|nr:hypothetical protein H310_10725 [Aphanomyces invadans]ETV96084.1 hypothetical protein H310_10725 [Aphanomyces invadans]|eukprot:XP_008875395.1 hypothetical protein H310_10725 [Aphanomyces invadans]